MPTICPTVTATDLHQYRQQMNRIAPFARRIHIDLMDGVFAPTKSPALSQVWWPPTVLADIHLMYADPAPCVGDLIRIKPHMVILPAEAKGDLIAMAHDLHAHGINVGVAVLAGTNIHAVNGIIEASDSVLIFSGHLGYHGGVAELGLLSKIVDVRERNSHAEIAWDGGINALNIRQLADAGVEVLNVGGAIHNTSDPEAAYAKLKELAEKPQ